MNLCIVFSLAAEYIHYYITNYIPHHWTKLQPTHSSPPISLSLEPERGRGILQFFLLYMLKNINSVGGDEAWRGEVGYEIFSIFRDEARLSFITISICIYFRKCVALSTGYLLTKFIVLSTKIYVIFLNHPSFINKHV